MTKLAIIIPYRNRKSHLEEFVPYMNEYLSKNISHEYSIVVVEQANQEKFNRGTLINIGFDLIKNECTYISPHDIDLLPEDGDYSVPSVPTHLAAFRSQCDYKLEYLNFFGGVNLFLNNHFEKINGFSNLYSGYGAEDDDLLHRCMVVGLTPERRACRYKSLPHQSMELTVENRTLYYDIINGKQSPTIQYEGLNSLKYTVLDIKKNNYIHYFVDFKNEHIPTQDLKL